MPLAEVPYGSLKDTEVSNGDLGNATWRLRAIQSETKGGCSALLILT